MHTFPPSLLRTVFSDPRERLAREDASESKKARLLFWGDRDGGKTPKGKPRMTRCEAFILWRLEAITHGHQTQYAAFSLFVLPSEQEKPSAWPKKPRWPKRGSLPSSFSPGPCPCKTVHDPWHVFAVGQGLSCFAQYLHQFVRGATHVDFWVFGRCICGLVSGPNSFLQGVLRGVTDTHLTRLQAYSRPTVTLLCVKDDECIDSLGWTHSFPSLIHVFSWSHCRRVSSSATMRLFLKVTR